MRPRRAPWLCAALAAFGLAMPASLAPESLPHAAAAPSASTPQVTASVMQAPAVTVVSAPPIVGIPEPCPAAHPWPSGAQPSEVVAQLSRNTGVRLTGADWTKPVNLPLVRIVWESVEGLSCTDYVRHVMMLHPGFTLNAAPISGFAWGDWGLTSPGATTLDFTKWKTVLTTDPGRLVRILVHELGHAWDSDRDTAAYWSTYTALQKKLGPISTYGRTNIDENFSEIVGYYVARCATNNPYNTHKFDGYYQFVRQVVFGGREFGPAPGSAPVCSLAGAGTTSLRPNLLTPPR